MIIDSKYRTKSANVLCYRDRDVSPFWKGVMWTGQTVKMDFRWHIGDGGR
jgi:hypothetical protein